MEVSGSRRGGAGLRAEPAIEQQGPKWSSATARPGPVATCPRTSCRHSRHDQRLIPWLTQQPVHEHGGAGEVVRAPGDALVHAEPANRRVSPPQGRQERPHVQAKLPCWTWPRPNPGTSTALGWLGEWAAGPGATQCLGCNWTPSLSSGEASVATYPHLGGSAPVSKLQPTRPGCVVWVPWSRCVPPALQLSRPWKNPGQPHTVSEPSLGLTGQ